MSYPPFTFHAAVILGWRFLVQFVAVGRRRPSDLNKAESTCYRTRAYPRNLSRPV